MGKKFFKKYLFSIISLVGMTIITLLNHQTGRLNKDTFSPQIKHHSSFLSDEDKYDFKNIKDTDFH